jgi:hypothetical protein
MTGEHLDTLVRHLRRSTAPGLPAAADDALLNRFIRAGDQTAFELLLTGDGRPTRSPSATRPGRRCVKFMVGRLSITRRWRFEMSRTGTPSSRGCGRK